MNGVLYCGGQPIAFGMPELEPITDGDGDQTLNGKEISFTTDLDYEKAKKIIPQGMRNAAILKRDGFLDVTNGELD